MIQYKKRRKYKYTLHSDYEYQTSIQVDKGRDLGLLAIATDGKLRIKKGYAWDGASGPAVDTKTIMRASLVHDALYQLMREGVIPQSQRERADMILREICIADKMSKLGVWCVYKAVRLLGARSARPGIHGPMTNCNKSLQQM